MSSTDVQIEAKPQVCFGGVIHDHAWNLYVTDEMGEHWVGYVFHATGMYGDGKFWLDSPGMRRRGYASLQNAIKAVERKFERISDTERIGRAVVASTEPERLRGILASLNPAARTVHVLKRWQLDCSEDVEIGNEQLVNWDGVAEYVCQLVGLEGGRMAETVKK